MRYEYHKRWGGDSNRDRANLAFKLNTFTYSLNSKIIFKVCDSRQVADRIKICVILYLFFCIYFLKMC